MHIMKRYTVSGGSRATRGRPGRSGRGTGSVRSSAVTSAGPLISAEGGGEDVGLRGRSVIEIRRFRPSTHGQWSWDWTSRRSFASGQRPAAVVILLDTQRPDLARTRARPDASTDERAPAPLRHLAGQSPGTANAAGGWTHPLQERDDCRHHPARRPVGRSTIRPPRLVRGNPGSRLDSGSVRSPARRARAPARLDAGNR